MSVLDKSVLTLQQVMELPLSIPNYQRPYKWTSKNVQQLLNDVISAFKENKSAYRLGTIVFHQELEKYDLSKEHEIVDGQQRTITLILIFLALKNNQKTEFDVSKLAEKLTFKSTISQKNIQQNYQTIERIISRSDFTKEYIEFLLERCEVVTFTLSVISEAFQFFDSQNARGKPLAPHDLLKAYHLREFSTSDNELKAATVKNWETTPTKELEYLFSNYLYHIRTWYRGGKAHPNHKEFNKDDIGLFKGINPDNSNYPHKKQLHIVHHFVDSYNHANNRKIDNYSMDFPFQLDQTIVNGRRFFEMVAHYKKLQEDLKNIKPKNILAKDIIDTINTYAGRNRTGDQCVRQMFECLLICYIDKFDYDEIDRAIEVAFVFTYSLRIESESIEKSQLDGHNEKYKIFNKIKYVTHPSEFINSELPMIEDFIKNAEERKRVKVPELITLFKKIYNVKS